MQARATKKYLPGSARKMRLLIDMIRGKNASEALALLRFQPKHAAKEAEQVLRSAVANLEQKMSDDGGRVDRTNVFVTEAFVNQGPMLKRISPAPMGRAYRIRKRMNHVTIVVSTQN